MTTDPSNIITALDEQLACYQRLAKLTEVQREHVQNNDAEALLGVLERRQGVLEELSRLERIVLPAKREWPAFTHTLAAEAREHVDSTMHQVRALLEQITKSDKDDVMLLQQRKVNVGRQINQATASRTVNRAYATAAYSQRPASMDVSQ